MFIIRWFFRAFGHDIVSVVDGGLPAWIANGGETTTTVQNVMKQNFDAKFDSALYKSYEQITDNLESKVSTVLDARSAGRFSGTDAEPRKGAMIIYIIYESYQTVFLSLVDNCIHNFQPVKNTHMMGAMWGTLSVQY